jgi:hypothetical protein
MTWKRAWNDWGSVAVALGACLGTFLLYEWAWHTGYNGSAIGLLGCHMMRLPLLLLTWFAVSSGLTTAANGGVPPARRHFSVLDLAGSLMIFAGCVGCYPLWPGLLVLLALALAGVMLLARKSAADPASAERMRIVLLSASVTVLLFILTWYLSASTTRQALYGLGTRFDERGGTDKLLAWAQERIQESKAKKRPPRFGRNELPDWLEDLLGNFEGVRSAYVVGGGDEWCVVLQTGGSAYHFRIDVCPDQHASGGAPWWAGEGNGLEWRPGITLEIEGK